MMLRSRSWIFVFSLFCSLTTVLASTVPAVPAGAVPASAGQVSFEDPRWNLQGQCRVETFDGRETLYVENGQAVLDDVPFRDGVIEFELMIGTERGFSGVRWRAQEGGHHEEFYLRPHQSGQVDANQYQPVFHGVAGWQIYYGADYSVPVSYRAGEWTKVRIEVLGDKAQMYIDSDEPLLVIDDLLHETRAGSLALFSGFAPARFSNFRYQLTRDLDIVDLPKAEGDGPARKSEGLIRTWSVSDAVAEASLDGATRLDPALLDGLEWHELGVERNGVANLARLQGLADGKNTAFVRLVLEAKDETIQRLDFGFSDRVRIYANGRLLYWGSDLWQSRDYRFLGTVGTYSAIFLPLRPGHNEILLAVSESFGGWAVTGKLVPEPGVRLGPSMANLNSHHGRF